MTPQAGLPLSAHYQACDLVHGAQLTGILPCSLLHHVTLPSLAAPVHFWTAAYSQGRKKKTTEWPGLVTNANETEEES